MDDDEFDTSDTTAITIATLKLDIAHNRQRIADLETLVDRHKFATEHALREINATLAEFRKSLAK